MDIPKIELSRFFKYAIVGSIGVAVDFSILYFLRENLHMDIIVANSLSFSVAVLGNYLLNKCWTFSEKFGFSYGQFKRFFIVSIAGLLLSTISIYLMAQILGMESYVSKALSILIVCVWNYLANKNFTFQKVKFERHRKFT